jgi:hypothetical protein
MNGVKAMTMAPPNKDNRFVQPAENMDADIFAKHMNFRHPESMAGWTLDAARTSPYVMRCYRAFHRTLHRLRPDLGHEHDVN